MVNLPEKSKSSNEDGGVAEWRKKRNEEITAAIAATDDQDYFKLVGNSLIH